MFIFTDDQRHDAMGCAGNSLIRTPNIDSLAARGVRFDRAFVTLSICSPSRAACLSGCYGSTNGVTTLGQALNAPRETSPEYLKQAGYQTGFSGKWHLKTTPTECGFDFVSYFLSNGRYYNRSVVEKGEKKQVPGFIDYYVADESIRFLESATRRKSPFVLWMCTQVPHMNHEYDWNARPETLAGYDPAAMRVPETWRDDLSGKPHYLKQARSRLRALEYGYAKPEAIQRHLQRYYAAVTEVDASIGKVLRAVERLGLKQNTWFILMGDNGWFMGEHGFTSKVLPYEESIRVPMIVAGPGIQPRADTHLVLNIDLTATMLDLARIPVPDQMHGRSLLPLIRGQEVNWRESFLYEALTPTLGSWPLLTVRTERWKYIQTYDIEDPSRCVFEELYHMQEDPLEVHNLAQDVRHATVVRQLSASLDKHRETLKPGP